MKYKVGDKVRIRPKEWFDDNMNKNEATYNSRCIWDERIRYCGRIGAITRASEAYNLFKLDLDGGYYDWSKDMFDDSYNPEKSILSEEVIKDIANVIKSHNLGVTVSENDGKLVIEPLNVEEEEDLKKGTHVMVTNDINNEAWTLRQYLSNGYCDAFRTDSFHLPPMKFRFIIAFEKFNPNDIEESLKYNIVK